MTARHYQELVVWQRAIEFVTDVYQMTKTFPRDEIYGLTNQLRRAVVSVPSNIAEGQGRGASVEFSRYLRIAQGSLQEVETQLIVANRLGYTSDEQLQHLMEKAAEVGRLNRGLMKSLSPATSN